LRGRPEFCRRGLPVYERQPGRLPDHGDGAYPRRVEGRVLCLGRPADLGATRGGRCPAEADPHRPSRLARDLWRAAHLRRPARAGRAAFPQTRVPLHMCNGYPPLPG
jgi:hypothetical protein